MIMHQNQINGNKAAAAAAAAAALHSRFMPVTVPVETPASSQQDSQLSAGAGQQPQNSISPGPPNAGGHLGPPASSPRPNSANG